LADARTPEQVAALGARRTGDQGTRQVPRRRLPLHRKHARPVAITSFADNSRHGSTWPPTSTVEHGLLVLATPTPPGSSRAAGSASSGQAGPSDTPSRHRGEQRLLGAGCERRISRQDCRLSVTNPIGPVAMQLRTLQRRFPPPSPPDSLPRRPATGPVPPRAGPGRPSWCWSSAERASQLPARATTARPASRRATGTRKGEHDT